MSVSLILARCVHGLDTATLDMVVTVLLCLFGRARGVVDRVQSTECFISLIRTEIMSACSCTDSMNSTSHGDRFASSSVSRRRRFRVASKMVQSQSSQSSAAIESSRHWRAMAVRISADTVFYESQESVAPTSRRRYSLVFKTDRLPARRPLSKARSCRGRARRPASPAAHADS
jgi:hypothetical protein